LIFGFEPPIMAQNIDNTCPYVIKIQEQYKVQVMFKTRSKLHATIVLVKGVEWEVEQVKQATILLMEFMCDNLAVTDWRVFKRFHLKDELQNQIPVQMSIQISPQHHQIVLGKNHSNLKAIMQYTKCQIMFPDAQDQNIPSLKKSNVNISGNIHNVYTARQLLIGSLPLLIIFDLPEDNGNLKIRSEQIAEIQTSCDVTINIRQKTKQMIKACIIKGIERHACKSLRRVYRPPVAFLFAANVYKARNLILGIDEPPIAADIPRPYSIPNVAPSSPFSPNHDLLTTPTNVNPPPMSPLVSPMFTWHYPAGGMSHTPPFVGMVQKPQLMYNVMQQSSTSSGFQSFKTESEIADTSLLSSISSNSSGGNFAPSPRCSSQSEVPSTSDYQSMSEKKPSPFENFDSKRLAGFKAMQSRLSPGMYRIPTSTWSGYGISHTSPAGFALKKDDDIWKSPEPVPSTSGGHLNTSNILDHTPTHLVSRVTSTAWSDLPSLLSSLGLDRYVSLFVRHEIDLATFSTMSDDDLMTIGVSAFGSRRKMSLAISELSKRSGSFAVAPGAERKSTSSNSPPSHDNSPKENW
jgi:protein bicaudal C